MPARFNVDFPQPRLPKEHTTWFIRMLIVLAVLLIAGIVYDFWRDSRVRAPTFPETTTEAPVPGS